MRATYEYLPVGDMKAQQLEILCKEYFEWEAKEYDNFNDEVERRNLYFQGIDDYARSKLNSLPECRIVMSFGCGTGRREVGIVKEMNPVPIVIGIENAQQMASIAKSRGLVVISQLGNDDSPSPESVQAVLCLYSFMHLPSFEARLEALQEMSKAMKVGGILIIDVFNLFDKHEWQSKRDDGGFGIEPPKSGNHRGDILYRRLGHEKISYMHYFTLSEITSLIEAAGLVVQELIGVGHGRHPGQKNVPLNEGCLLLTCVKER